MRERCSWQVAGVIARPGSVSWAHIDSTPHRRPSVVVFTDVLADVPHAQRCGRSSSQSPDTPGRFA
ncbi:hypothetical protein H0B56_19840 [Haloechinothrix sp. YIM 98757]|uniref:Uncharacterized protein n=1 Tax=Haloechinothrix aidingensis TaxID=2752311 RepID=A0A838AEP3_9PSEU|nr:hypothetical protein [Haloechinothrix aidingensis]MBA0127804.1 hypothetical protein [Haloechinothrix aidingensis]